MAVPTILLLALLLALLVALLALAWRDNRRTVARVDQFQATWREEIQPARALLLALEKYDTARQAMLAARRRLDTTPPGNPARERHRVALIEAQVAYDEARDGLHEHLDGRQFPRMDALADDEDAATPPRQRDDHRDPTGGRAR